ncbi:hypothetical protein GGI19_006936, partial [Coemansia pectinata]
MNDNSKVKAYVFTVNGIEPTLYTFGTYEVDTSIFRKYDDVGKMIKNTIPNAVPTNLSTFYATDGVFMRKVDSAPQWEKGYITEDFAVLYMRHEVEVEYALVELAKSLTRNEVMG